ncbi:MAG: hypothetical protein M3O34_20235 [Chloroflexota bacterium]|nr:hypothetical protein [Chloroflexota bacterium]
MPELPSASDIQVAAAATVSDDEVGGGVELDLGPAPSADEVERIVARADPVLRNLEITLAYCRLSRELGRLLGRWDAEVGNANWCTFATWASKRAGRTIRGDDLGKLRERLRRRLERDGLFEGALHRLNARLLRRRLPIPFDKERIASRVLALVDDMSVSIADGNLKVFAEPAPPFSEVIAQFDGDAALDREKLDQLLGRFAPGPTSEGGQDLLRSAFASFVHALFAQDEKAKAELILLANVQVGLHEQTRLQPNIARALVASIQHLGDWLAEDIGAKLPPKGRLSRRTRGELHDALLAVVGRIWREEATRYLMTLPVPGEVLGLGWDIPPRPGRPMFPPALQELLNAELVAFLREHDRTWNTTVGSGAADWTSLPDRMHYIADLFRSRQQRSTLYHAPFTSDQCRAILDRRIPDGML